MSAFKFFWTTHKWVGIVAAVLVCNTAVTGFLLLVKKNYAWIQPPEVRGAEKDAATISFDQILRALQTVPEAEVTSWSDVDRLDVRPGKGMLKARANNDWEVQVDLSSGEVLQVAYRRSDFIESIHDGSFYHDTVHAWVMPVFAIAMIFLAGSGLFLWLEPKWRRAKRRRRVRQGVSNLKAGV